MTDELKEVRNRPNKELIIYLEKYLEMAKSGEIQGIADVVVWHNGATSQGWLAPEQGWYLSHIIGELYMLIVRFSNINEKVVEVEEPKSE